MRGPRQELWQSRSVTNESTGKPPNPQTPQRGRVRTWLRSLNWKWIGVLAILGLGFSGLAFVARYWIGYQGGKDWIPWILLDKDDLPVVQSLLTNVGTAFLTGLILVFFKPYLDKAVRETAADETKKVNAKLAARVTSVENRVNSVIRTEMTSLDALIAAIPNDFRYETVHAAMVGAANIGAIDSAGITVQGTELLGELVVNFSPEIPKDGDPSTSTDGADQLLVQAWTTRQNGSFVDVSWKSGEDVADVVLELRRRLQREQIRGLSEPIQWDQVMKRLSDTLALAVRSWRRDSDVPQLGGRLLEIVGNRWYITDDGVEAPDFGIMQTASSWPAIRMSGDFGPPRPLPFEKPVQVDETEWKYVLDRGDALFAETLDSGGNRLPVRLKD